MRSNAILPRPEYPRPQFVRQDWLCLNGEWQFEMDFGDSGLERGLLERELKDRILVPFCPESPLSGIEYTDFMNAVWYRRTVEIPKEWTGRRVLLHFEAVDYDATVWVNGQEVYRHRGGYTPFTCDLHGVVKGGDAATIVVRARDDARNLQPSGKQSKVHNNIGCHYRRTTGIWQTVWMEPVPYIHLCRPRLTPDVANSAIRLEQPISQNKRGYQLRATLKDNQGVVCAADCRADMDLAPRLDFVIPEGRRKLWGPGEPNLYDLDIEMLDPAGNVVDSAKSYSGLRSVAIDGLAVKINGKPVFQRLVLDQGFYPDGIYTAVSDEALRRDIELSMAAGFNGARLHQKVFEERFLYWADKLGYLVWEEFADWGYRWPRPHSDKFNVSITYAAQWCEALERDYSHPSIIGWCPLNEIIQKAGDEISEQDDIMRALYLATKAMDASRPVIDVSGFSHRVPETDIWDVHDYGQDAEKLRETYANMVPGKFQNQLNPPVNLSTQWRGQPFFISEFGGTHWDMEARKGYGPFRNMPVESEEELNRRFEELCGVLLDNSSMFGYCFTQLTDVYQEINGVYTFDRRPKYDIARICKAQKRMAAIEKGKVV